jgi:hypothetical protein
MPLESRPLGRLSCFPEPNKNVGSPVAASPRSIPPHQKKQNEQNHLRIFKGFFLAVRLSLSDQKFTETGPGVMTDLI